MRPICLAVAANAVIVFGPAAIVSGGRLFGQYEVAVALFGLSLAIGLELGAQSPDRTLTEYSTSSDRAASRFNRIHGLLLLAGFQVLAIAAATKNGQPSLRAVGIGLVVLGSAAALRLSAIRHLGRDFSDGFRLVATRIVRTGPYFVFRHPAELGLVLLPVGFATILDVQEWLPMVWPPIAAASCFRIWKEEQGIMHRRSLTA